MSAYAPYSGFEVMAGIQILGETFYGKNIENACSQLTLCAERVAISKAVEAAYLPHQPIDIVSLYSTDPELRPCPICLQWIWEFGNESTVIRVVTLDPHRYPIDEKRFLLKDLYPKPYTRRKKDGTGRV